jgi:hypothetical protein
MNQTEELIELQEQYESLEERCRVLANAAVEDEQEIERLTKRLELVTLSRDYWRWRARDLKEVNFALTYGKQP